MSQKDYKLRIYSWAAEGLSTTDHAVESVDHAKEVVAAAAHHSFHVYDEVGTLVAHGWGNNEVTVDAVADKVEEVAAVVEDAAQTATETAEAAPVVEDAVEEVVAVVEAVVAAPAKKSKK